VALTRAKYGLVICGNAKVLGKVYKTQNLWLNLLAHFKQHELVVEGALANLKPLHITFETPERLPGGGKYFGGESRLGSVLGGSSGAAAEGSSGASANGGYNPKMDPDYNRLRGAGGAGTSSGRNGGGPLFGGR